MTTISDLQAEILRMATQVHFVHEAFGPSYRSVKVSGRAWSSARRLELRGLLIFLEDWDGHAIYMGNDAGRDALAEYDKRRADEAARQRLTERELM